MSGLAFAYALRLKAPDRTDAILSVLPECRRREVEQALAQAKELTVDEVHSRWQQLRREERRKQYLALYARAPKARRFSPRLQTWMLRSK